MYGHRPTDERGTGTCASTHPRAATTITEETIEVPGGRFETTLYTVRAGPIVRRYWLARTLPGPPVKMEIENAGRTMRLTLVEHRSG